MQGSNEDTDLENKLMDMGVGEEGGGWDVWRATWKHILPYVKSIANGNLPCDSGNSNQGSVTTSRGRMGKEVERRFKREGT